MDKLFRTQNYCIVTLSFRLPRQPSSNCQDMSWHCQKLSHIPRASCVTCQGVLSGSSRQLRILNMTPWRQTSLVVELTLLRKRKFPRGHRLLRLLHSLWYFLRRCDPHTQWSRKVHQTSKKKERGQADMIYEHMIHSVKPSQCKCTHLQS